MYHRRLHRSFIGFSLLPHLPASFLLCRHQSMGLLPRLRPPHLYVVPHNSAILRRQPYVRCPMLTECPFQPHAPGANLQNPTRVATPAHSSISSAPYEELIQKLNREIMRQNSNLTREF